MIQSLLRPLARVIAVAFVATLVLAPTPVQAQSGDSLETVLSKQANVSTYRGLLSTYSDVFNKLPSSGVTILVPTDGAFVRFQGWDRGDREYAASLLQYHILQGRVSLGGLQIGDSTFAQTLLTGPKYTNVTGGALLMVTKQQGDIFALTSGMATRGTVVGTTDIPFDGGLVQLVDSILTQPERLEQTARVAYTDLTSFLGAAYVAGVVPQLAETPNITIFAPRNLAMQLVGGTLQSLPREQLARVLQYHLVPGRVVHSSELVNGTNFTSAVEGSPPLHITRFNNDIFLGSARIIQQDILIANGVVHMLEDVLNPDAGELRPDVSQQTQSPAFTVTGPPATGTAAPIPFTSALPCTTGCPGSGGGGGGGGGRGGGPNSVSSSSSSGVAGGNFPMATGVAGIALGLAGMEAIRGIM